jgi:hypothetical protein
VRYGTPARKIAALFDWLFRNRETGQITIVQFPNVALWIFIVTVILRRVLADSAARTAIDAIGVAALAWWALDELVRGVNPWRRLLGVAGGIAACAGLVRLLR